MSQPFYSISSSVPSPVYASSLPGRIPSSLTAPTADANTTSFTQGRPQIMARSIQGGAMFRQYLPAVLAILFVSGCTSSGGRFFGLFPSGQPLTEDARNAREATPPPPDIARELDKRVAAPYVVEPGDVLLVLAVSLDSPVRLPGDQPVLLDGTIHLGKYGHYQAAGKTVPVIEREVGDLIRRQEKDAGPIIARLVTRESKVFYVLGEVNAPGSYNLRGRETVLDAIVAAGNLTGNASRRGIILSRPTAPDSCRIVLPVCYNDIVQMGDTTTNYQLRPGDRVFVPSKSFTEGLMELFKKPDPSCCRPQVPCPPGAACAHPPGPPAVEPGPLPAKIELPRPNPTSEEKGKK